MPVISSVNNTRGNRIALWVVYFVATIWLILLLFPLYYTIVLASADRAATVEVPPRLDLRLAKVAVLSVDMTPFVKDNLDLSRSELEDAIMGEVAVSAARPLYVERELLASRVIASVNGQVIADVEVPEWRLTKYYNKWINLGPDRARAEGAQFMEAFGGKFYPEALEGAATEVAPGFADPAPGSLGAEVQEKLSADGALDNLRYQLTIEKSLNHMLDGFRWTIGPKEIWTDVSQGSVPRWFFNSLVYAIGVIIAQLTVSAMAGYALSRLWPSKTAYVLELFFLATMMLPAFLLFLPMFLMMRNFPLPTVPFSSIKLPGVNLMNTYWALILPHTAWAFSILLFRGFFDQLPGEVFQAARIDGASEWGIFSRIVFPLSRPIYATMVIYTFTAIWAEFSWPYLVSSKQKMWTLSIGLFQSAGAAGSSGEPTKSMAMALISAIPPLFIFTFFQRYLVQGIALTGIKG